MFEYFVITFLNQFHVCYIFLIHIHIKQCACITYLHTHTIINNNLMEYYIRIIRICTVLKESQSCQYFICLQRQRYKGSFKEETWSKLPICQSCSYENHSNSEKNRKSKRIGKQKKEVMGKFTDRLCVLCMRMHYVFLFCFVFIFIFYFNL